MPVNRFFSTDRRNMLLCVILFVICAAVANPRYEMGFNDDWAYTSMARTFALTHHFAYNGWPSMLLLPQLVWAALFIKLFGFSFFITRLSTLVLCVFITPVLYRLGRISGLSPSFAVFVTLLTMLSPLMLPLAASFMSDVPAFVLFLLCFFASVEAWQAASARACVAWGALAALTGTLSGLDRQIYFPAPLLFLGAVAFVHRRHTKAVVGLAVAWLISLAAALYALAWFEAQPYVANNVGIITAFSPWDADTLLRLALGALRSTSLLALMTGLLLLPLLLGFAVAGFKTARRVLAVVAGVCVLVGVTWLIWFPDTKFGVNSILTDRGIMGNGVTVLGDRPVIVPPLLQHILVFAALLSGAGCLLALSKDCAAIRGRFRHSLAAPAVTLGMLFAAVWLPAVLLRGVKTDTYDRYLIPFVPLIAIPLAVYYQARIRPRLSPILWAILSAFAIYAVSITHDYAAVCRARVAVAQELLQDGIPRTEILAGFDYDGSTQIADGGHVNYTQISSPPNAYHVPTCTGMSRGLWYIALYPAIRARYFVPLSHLNGLPDAPEASVSYTTWLPPATSQIFPQVYRGDGFVGCR